MTRADSEEEKQATDQSTKQEDILISIVLADLFKDGFPDWFQVINLGGGSNDAAAILDAVPVPVEPSLFDPETANECAEAVKDGFPAVNQEGETNVSDAVMDATGTAQSSMSVSVPVVQPSFYEAPQSHLERFDEWGSLSF